MSMTLDIARALLLETVKQDATVFTPTQLDTALQVALLKFCRDSTCTRTTFTQAITAGATSVTLTAGTSPVPSDWMRYRTLSLLAVVSGQPPVLAAPVLPGGNRWEDRLAPHLNLWWAIPGVAQASAGLGLPVGAMFQDDSTLVFWPAPTINFNWVIKYWQPLVSWTLGTASPSGVTLNVASDYLTEAIVSGAATQLLSDSPGGRIGGESQFEALIAKTYAALNADLLVAARYNKSGDDIREAMMGAPTSRRK